MLIPTHIMNLTKCADDTSNRYALGGIRFERDEAGQAHAVATDGRRLVHVTWDEDPWDEFPAIPGASPNHVKGFETILPSSDCRESMKLPAKKSFKPILTNVLLCEPTANGEVIYAGTDMERKRVVQTKSVDGKFPPWRDAIPTYHVLKEQQAKNVNAVYGKEASVGAKITVDAKLLAELCDTLLKAAPHDNDSNNIEITVPLCNDTPVLIHRKGDSGEEIEAVLMPLSRDR